MDDEHRVGFVDDFGNSDQEASKGGISGFSVVSAILVTDQDLEVMYEQTKACKNFTFGPGISTQGT